MLNFRCELRSFQLTFILIHQTIPHIVHESNLAYLGYDIMKVQRYDLRLGSAILVFQYVIF